MLADGGGGDGGLRGRWVDDGAELGAGGAADAVSPGSAGGDEDGNGDAGTAAAVSMALVTVALGFGSTLVLSNVARAT